MIIRNRNRRSRRNLAIVYLELSYSAEALDRDMNAVIAHLRRRQSSRRTSSPGRRRRADHHHPPSAGPSRTSLRLGTAHHHLGEIAKALEEYRQASNLRAEVLASPKDDLPMIRARPSPRSRWPTGDGRLLGPAGRRRPTTISARP